MNDTTEMVYALDMAQTVIKARIESGTYSPDTLKFLNSFRDAFKNPASAAYVISLTALPDALSQWRAYCPPSGGYAISLPTSRIKDLIAKPPHPAPPANGFELLKCIYDPTLQQQIMNHIIDACIDEYEQNLGDRRRRPLGGITHIWTSSSYNVFALDCYNYIQEVALMFKHEGFKEEEEWRLAYFTNLDNEQTVLFGKLSFRASNRGILPYKIFSLIKPLVLNVATSQSKDPGLDVRVGPCANPEQRRNALWLLSVKNGYGVDPPQTKDGRITISATPYKSW